MKILAGFFLLTAGLLAQRTTVTDTIRNGNGTLSNGTITITPNQQFTAVGGVPVYPVPTIVRVTQGVFSVALYPNDTTVDPVSGTSYSAAYALTGQSPPNITETWVVPTSGSPVHLAAVRVNPVPTPQSTIPLSLLSRGGGSTGQCLVLGPTFWGPSSSCGGGGGDSVLGGSNLTVTGSIPFQNGTLATVTQVAGFTWTASGLSIPSGAYNIAGSKVISFQSTPANYWFAGAGNATATGIQNTGLGNQALFSLTTGTGNNAFGFGAMFSCTTCSGDTINGNGALSSATTAINDSALGFQALYGITTGSYLSAIGYQAGRYISGGVTLNTASDHSVYMGSNAYPLGASDTNEIVIGATTTGLGSNTTVIGNSSTVTTGLYGDVQKFNGSTIHLSGIASPGGSGNCPEFAANGIDLVSTGAPCGSGGGGGVQCGTSISTTTLTAEIGASVVPCVYGFNDTTFAFAASPTVVITGAPTGNGSWKLYITPAGGEEIQITSSSAGAFVGTNVNVLVVTSPAFPVGAYPKATGTITASSTSWTTVVDARPSAGDRAYITAGNGIGTIINGVTAIDSTVPQKGATNAFTGINDYSAGFLRPPSGASLPATCAVNDTFDLTSASAAARWNICTSTNTWTTQGTATGCAAVGATGTIQASNGSGACQATSGIDNGTNVTFTEPVLSPSISIGVSPPASSVCGPNGTSPAAFVCLTEGNTPIGTGASVDTIWATSGHRLNQILNGVNDTLVGANTTDAFQNKTYDTGATGNSFKIAGTAITSVSGTGATVCLATGSVCGGGYNMTTAGQGSFNFMNATGATFFAGLSSLGGATGALCEEYNLFYASAKITSVYFGTGTADASNYVAAFLYNEAGTLISGSTTTGQHIPANSTIGITLTSPPTINSGPGYLCVGMGGGTGTLQLVDQSLPGSVWGESTKRFFTITGVSWSTATATPPSTLGTRTAGFNAVWALGTP